MNDMQNILRTLANYTRNSGFTVTVNGAFSAVAIENQDGEGIFLQDHEADAFIEQAKKIADENDLPHETGFYSSAASYIDCL